MNHVSKKILLLAVLSINLILAACGGGGSDPANGAAADYLSINGTKYTADGSTVHVGGFVDQTSQYTYQYGGPAAVIWMYDAQSGNLLTLQALSTINGWPGTYSLLGVGTSDTAYVTDKAVATGGNMGDWANGSSTGGHIAVSSFGDIGQPITGTFNVNLCDRTAVCSASIKNYTGAFSITRTANFGSLAKPVYLTIQVPAAPYPQGIYPATGKNYYTIPTNATGGTLTITLTPAFNADVNMAVFTDAGFATPATCNVTSTLNVAGNGVETCAITVAANQKVYVTVSQTAAATGVETYTLKVAE